MTLSELKTDEALRHREFPVTRDGVFLAHAAVAPLPRRVADAIRDYAAASARGDQELMAPADLLQRTRSLAARLLGVDPGEIALVGPTSLALSFVAGGLDLTPGDNVVAYLDDYPSNVYPWMALAGRGVQTRFLQPREFGRIDLEDVQACVDARTRLVALASAHFLTGYRPDLAAIGGFLQARGVRFCVDAIQTLGAFPAAMDGVDFLAADSHKWLLGPCAAGLLCVRRARQNELRPTTLGWHNLRCPDFVTQEELVFRSDARRYEAGTANLLGLVGWAAALELLLEIGLDAIAAELQRQRAVLVAALRAGGWEVLQADAPPRHASGIVTLHRAGTDMTAVHRWLETAGIRTSLRADRAGRRYVRLSPHFYNTDADFERLLARLAAFPGGRERH